MIFAVSSLVIDMLRFMLKNSAEKCRDENQFFSIIEEVFGEIQRNRGKMQKLGKARE